MKKVHRRKPKNPNAAQNYPYLCNLDVSSRSSGQHTELSERPSIGSGAIYHVLHDIAQALLYDLPLLLLYRDRSKPLSEAHRPTGERRRTRIIGLGSIWIEISTR